jgi:dihydrofolate reductase
MIHALFAVDQYGGMGFNGTMPWPHNSADLKNFKELTTGHVVVMGRKTWDDKNMPKPLKGRTTYVATHQPFLQYTAVISGDMSEQLLALEQKHPDKIIWVIGGPELLEQCHSVLDRMYLTHYKGSFKIDTRLNMKQFLAGWSPKTATADPNNNFTTVVYESLFKRIRRSPE